MDKEKIEFCLADNVPIKFTKIRGSRLAAKGTNRALRNIIYHAPTETTYREINVKESESYQDLYLNVKNALANIGKVVEEDEHNGVIAGVILAGASDMNPALLVVDVEPDNLKISSYAKEGLIKQHTGEEAIDKFLKAL